MVTGSEQNINACLKSNASENERLRRRDLDIALHVVHVVGQVEMEAVRIQHGEVFLRIRLGRRVHLEGNYFRQALEAVAACCEKINKALAKVFVALT